MKKKNGHKKIILVILFLIILAAVIIGIVLWKKKVAAEAADTSVHVLVEDGQELVYGQIVEICGNDMTYSPLEEITEEQSSEEGQSGPPSGTPSESPSGTPSESSSGTPSESPSGTPPAGDSSSESTVTLENGDIQTTVTSEENTAENVETFTTVSVAGVMPGGGMPSGGMPSGEMPGGGSGGMDFSFMGGDGSTDDGITIDEKSYQATEEEITVQIPVGTPVTTKLGTETTFSRLAAGDALAIIYDGENIVRIYIVG